VLDKDSDVLEVETVIVWEELSNEGVVSDGLDSEGKCSCGEARESVCGSSAGPSGVKSTALLPEMIRGHFGEGSGEGGRGTRCGSVSEGLAGGCGVSKESLASMGWPSRARGGSVRLCQGGRTPEVSGLSDEDTICSSSW